MERYIRTSQGYILDRNAEEHKNIIKALENEEISAINKFGEIENSKKEILDLVKEWDYVNGYNVRKINGELCNFDLNNMEWIPLKNIDVIGNITTKERFEEVEYIV